MRLGYVRNEQRVRAAIHRGDHLAGDHGVRMLGKVCNAVFRARLAAGKLIRRAPALKTVLFEQAERCAFREHGNVERARFFDHIMRIIRLVHRDGDAHGRACELLRGVDDAAVVLCSIPRSEHKQAVAELEHCVAFHLCRRGRRRRFLFQGCCNGIREAVQRGELAFLERGFNGELVVKHGDVFELAEQFRHQLARRGCPGAVFDEGHRAVLQVVRGDVKKRRFHVAENARVVRGGSEHQMAAAERFGNDHRGMRCGNIVHGNLLHAARRKLGGKDVRCVFRVAVHGGISDHHGVVLRRIGAPFLIFFNEPGKVRAPNGPMQRADHVDVHRCCLLEQRLHLCAVFADDVHIVAPCIVQPVAFKIHLIRKKVAGERAERAECIRRKERLCRGVVGDHGLRPMHHRRHQERKRVAASRERIALGNNLAARINIKQEKLPDHRNGLRVGDDGYLRVAQHEFFHRGGMIRLHVVDDEVIKLPSGQHVRKAFKEYAAHGFVHGVEQNGFFIQKNIGVVGHAARDRKHVFKQGKPAVVPAHPEKILADRNRMMHRNPPDNQPKTGLFLNFSIPQIGKKSTLHLQQMEKFTFVRWSRSRLRPARCRKARQPP